METKQSTIFHELEEAIDDLFEQEIAYIRLQRISLELSQFRNQGGVRADL